MSKTFLIIGDSWGVPNYDYPEMGSDPKTHTENLLRQLGYKVYNCSLNGGSHDRTVNLAEKYLSGVQVTLEPIRNHKLYPANTPCVIDVVNPQIDYVIWFHTEYYRGCFRDHNEPIVTGLEKNAHADYAYVTNFLKKLNSKVIVVGGQSPVMTHVLTEYLTPDLLIEDWRSELIGYKLPEVHTLTKVEWIEDSKDTLDFKNSLLEKHKIILDAMSKSDYFIDNIHPDGEAHKLLTERIHKFVSLV